MPSGCFLIDIGPEGKAAVMGTYFDNEEDMIQIDDSLILQLQMGLMDKKLFVVTKNVFTWLDSLTIDNKIASCRLGLGGNPNIAFDYDLTAVPEFVKVFHEIKKALGEWGADATKKGKK